MDNLIFVISLYLLGLSVFTFFFLLRYKEKHRKFTNKSLQVKDDESAVKQKHVLYDKFDTIVFHELRSPLTSIRGAVENLLNYSSRMTKKELRQSLEIVEYEAQEMLTLINNLQDVSKLDSGKLTVLKTVGDLGKTTKEVVDKYIPYAKHKNIQIKFEKDGELTSILFDRDRIRQVLNNLIRNAIKHTEKGAVIVSCKRDDKNVRVIVSDTGIGIAKDKIGRLFTKYYQLQHSGYKKEGIGLGLAVSKGIIEAHNGKIWIESKEGIGSKFIFTLPVGNKG